MFAAMAFVGVVVLSVRASFYTTSSYGRNLQLLRSLLDPLKHINTHKGLLKA